MQNAIKLENISNLITSPSSYQCSGEPNVVECILLWVPVKCETKYTETKRNEIHRSETKFTETKRNGIIQNEIKPILTKQFLGERKDKN